MTTHDPPASAAQSAARTGPYEDEISLLEVTNLVLRHRYRLLGTALAFAALGLLVAFVGRPTYRASASFVPQGSDTRQGRLASLAGQFGVEVPLGESAGESPAFYAELLRSREILRPVAEAEFEFVEGTPGSEDAHVVSGRLPDLLRIDEDTPELEALEAMEWLREEALDVQTDAETGMVSLSVATPWAGLSHDVAQRLVTLVNEFNLGTRQSRAAAEREFIEARMAEAEDSLLAAEDRLEAFLQANRQFENSPELLFRHDRLQRQVARQQEVVTSLAQAYEEARINEVRNTPVITVVEPAARPLEPESRDIPLNVGLGLVLGGILGLFWAFGLELLRRERENGSDTYREFRDLWSHTWRDVRTLGGRLS